MFFQRVAPTLFRRHVAAIGVTAASLHAAGPGQPGAFAEERRKGGQGDVSFSKAPTASFKTFGEVMMRYIPDPTWQIGADGENPTTSRWLQNPGGAELNIVVSLTKLGWKDAQWVSVTPEGHLGDHLMRVIAVGLDGNDVPLSNVRREPGELGIYHVWPAERKLVYQRRNSIFGQQDPMWFNESFWSDLLTSSAVAEKPSLFSFGKQPPQPLQFLHMTGITPLISRNAATSWHQALSAAGKLHRPDAPLRARLVISFDFNHRPALGTFHQLWKEVRPHLDSLDLLILSVGDCVNLANELGDAEVIDPVFRNPALAPAGEAGAEAYDAAAQRTLRGLRQLISARCKRAPPALVLPVKRTDPARNEPGKPAWQMRWSMVLSRKGEMVSTLSTAVQQWPAEPIGGGDAWFSGLVDGLAGSGGPSSENCLPFWTSSHWADALRRADLLAALKQTVVGDFSHVTREDLEKALKFEPRVDPL